MAEGETCGDSALPAGTDLPAPTRAALTMATAWRLLTWAVTLGLAGGTFPGYSFQSQGRDGLGWDGTGRWINLWERNWIQPWGKGPQFTRGKELDSLLRRGSESNFAGSIHGEVSWILSWGEEQDSPAGRGHGSILAGSIQERSWIHLWRGAGFTLGRGTGSILAGSTPKEGSWIHTWREENWIQPLGKGTSIHLGKR